MIKKCLRTCIRQSDLPGNEESSKIAAVQNCSDLFLGQFYRKNKDLSADAKEKLKSALQHARNNFREVFVADYVNWIKYESQGSFRLNKITRDILVRYCPFSREVRAELNNNPLFQNAFNKLDLDNQKNLKRLQAVYRKYEDAGGTITPELTENLKFYQM